MVEPVFWTLTQAIYWMRWRRFDPAAWGEAPLLAGLRMAWAKPPGAPEDAFSNETLRRLLEVALQLGHVEAIGLDGEPIPRKRWAARQLVAGPDGGRVIVVAWPDRYSRAPFDDPVVAADAVRALCAAWPDPWSLPALTHQPQRGAEQRLPLVVSGKLDLVTLWTLAKEFPPDPGDEPEEQFGRHFLDTLDAIWTGALATEEIVFLGFERGTDGPQTPFLVRPADLAVYLLKPGEMRESLRGRLLDFYTGQPSLGSYFRYDGKSHGRQGVAISRADYETWRRKPTPQARTLHPEFPTVLQHARAWHDESPGARITVEELAEEMIRDAAAGTFERAIESTAAVLNESGELPSNFDVRSRRLVETFNLAGGCLDSHQIAALIEVRGDDRLAVAALIRLSPAGFDRWRESAKVREWARDPRRRLSVAADPAEPSIEAPSEPSGTEKNGENTAPDWPADLRRWFFDEVVPMHPKGLSGPALEAAAREKFGELTEERRDDVRQIRRDPKAPRVWNTPGPKGRGDKRP